MSKRDREEYEKLYGQLGWWKGPFATSQARNSTRDFWINKGAAGAEWLAERIRSETHPDALEAVGNLIADIGCAAIDPIIRKLQHETTRDQSEVLLKALGWIENTHDAPAVDLELGEKTLEKYFVDQDADIRAAAYAATRILPRDRAIARLNGRRSFERDPSALEALNAARDARLTL